MNICGTEILRGAGMTTVCYYSCSSLLWVIFCHADKLFSMLVVKQLPRVRFLITCWSGLFRFRFIRGFTPVETTNRVGIGTSTVRGLFSGFLTKSLRCLVLVAFPALA